MLELANAFGVKLIALVTTRSQEHRILVVILLMLSLAAKALLSVLLLAVVMGVILFVAAGTIDYWQAWVYLLIFTLTSLLTTIYLIRNIGDN